MTVLAILASAVAAAAEVPFCSSPLVGTQGMGNVTPAACAPFGLVQAGPDTSASAARYEFGKAHCGGYQYQDAYVWRFSQTHVSGMGCTASGNLGILPVIDEIGLPDRGAKMRKETETVGPGRYAVTLEDGIRCEIAAGRAKADYSFAFPKGSRQQLLDEGGRAVV